MKAKSQFHPFPKPISFWRLLGPSFLLLALGFGSGEVILWPYLVSNFGLGIAWGALLGISFQYFINMEIERYALVKGESVFVGLFRFFRPLALWFIFSTFLGFALPGIVLASAKVFAVLFGLQNYHYLAVALLFLIGVVLSSSDSVYDRLEKLTRTLIFLALPILFIIAVLSTNSSDWQALIAGFQGRGEGYNFLPEAISLATFLGAFAYSGAGGNLNLTQSIFIREKGYGMGFHSQKLAGLFRRHSKDQDLDLSGKSFELNSKNVYNFKAWWKKISLEHFLIFWGGGLLGMSLLMLLSYATAFGKSGNETGIDFVLSQASHLTSNFSYFLAPIFLTVIALLLLQTQTSILDSTSRIICENIALLRGGLQNNKHFSLSKIYFSTLWIQIGFGMILILSGQTEPKSLIVLGAVINAIAMTVHIALVSLLNHHALPKETQAPTWRKALMFVIFCVFVLFCVVAINAQL